MKKKIFLAILAILFLIIAFNLAPKKKVFLSVTEHTETQSATFYVFKNEEYRVLKSDTPLNITMTEGEKVGANSLLASTKTDLSDYIGIKLRAVEYLIANPSLSNMADVYSVMLHTKTQLDVIDEKLTQAMKDKNEEAKKILSEQRSEKQAEYEILKTALLYVHMSSDQLYYEKDILNSLYSQSSLDITPANLNFTIYGNIYYSIDGYEDEMTFDALDGIDNEYFQKIEKLVYSFKPAANEYYFKSTATDKIVVCAKIKADTFVEAEYEATALTEGIYTEYTLSEGFYNFLYTHIGVLNRYPQIAFVDKGGTTINGRLLNVIYDGDSKYLVICIRDNFKYFMEKRIFKADIIAEKYDCFIVPSSSVYENETGSFVTAVDSLNEQTSIAVKVYKKKGSELYLKTNQNTQLFEYDEILYRGKKNDQR